MTETTENKNTQAEKTKEIVFKCQFCGETKTISELMIMRQYYPQLSSCKDCARGTLISKPEEPANETEST